VEEKREKCEKRKPEGKMGSKKVQYMEQGIR
jgi:hypothetical protein